MTNRPQNQNALGDLMRMVGYKPPASAVEHQHTTMSNGHKSAAIGIRHSTATSVVSPASRSAAHLAPPHTIPLTAATAAAAKGTSPMINALKANEMAVANALKKPSPKIAHQQQQQQQQAAVAAAAAAAAAAQQQQQLIAAANMADLDPRLFFPAALAVPTSAATAAAFGAASKPQFAHLAATSNAAAHMSSSLSMAAASSNAAIAAAAAAAAAAANPFFLAATPTAAAAATSSDLMALANAVAAAAPNHWPPSLPQPPPPPSLAVSPSLDTFNAMQSPTAIAKMYNSYLLMLQQQHQQRAQLQQLLVAQQTQQYAAAQKQLHAASYNPQHVQQPPQHSPATIVASTPRAVGASAATIVASPPHHNNNLFKADPLGSLQQMVHPSTAAAAVAATPTVTMPKRAPPPPSSSIVVDDGMIVDRPSIGDDTVSPHLASSSPTSASFSIAEILQSANANGAPLQHLLIASQQQPSIVVSNQQSRELPRPTPIATTIAPPTSLVPSSITIATVTSTAASHAALTVNLPAASSTVENENMTIDTTIVPPTTATTTATTTTDGGSTQHSPASTSSGVKRSPTASSVASGAVPRRLNQRKAFIDFHRRLKVITTRPTAAVCQLCGELVSNNCSELTAHVYDHSPEALFGCIVCEASFRQRVDVHRHSAESHPNEKEHDMPSDLRNMGKLCDLLDRCFPRNQKLAMETLLTRLIKASKGRTELQCKLCEKEVLNTHSSIKQHLNAHKRYRCRLCAFTSVDATIINQHAQTTHPSTDVMEATYILTPTIDVIATLLVDCFGDYMPDEQRDAGDDMIVATTLEQTSPQSTAYTAAITTTSNDALSPTSAVVSTHAAAAPVVMKTPVAVNGRA